MGYVIALPFSNPSFLQGAQEAKSGASLRRTALELHRKPDQLGAGLKGRTGEGDAAGVAAPGRDVKDFEAAVAAAGLLSDRPPLDPGDGGRSSYVVQPMQMLSWYPR